MYVLRGYAASWAMPSMFVAGNANPYLDIHCEASLPGLHLTGLSDTLFVIAPIDPTTGTGNPSSGFSGTFIDAGLFATNSLFAFDTEGHYGAPVAAWGASNAKVEINPQARSMELFDATPPGTMVGGINYNGDIFVGSVLYTASTHYHNRLGTRTGRLMLGDTSTNYSADSVNTKSVVASDQLIAGNNVQSQRGAMLSSLGFQVTDGAGMLPVYASLVRGSVSLGAVGAAGTPGTSIPFVAFHGPGNTSGTPTHKIVELTAGTLDVQGNGTNNAYVRVDGTLSIVAPLTLPNGSVAVTQAPGDNDTSVATTAFVQAAATAAAGAIVLPAPATTIPLVEGIGAPGTLTTYARADHVHPASQGAVINTQTIAAITANTITVPAGTNHIVVQDSINAVNTLTVGSGTLADGYDMWLHFSNGGSFAGVPVSAHGNLTLKVFAGGWSILAKFG
jgi:hypothetical protein